jgi:hypothetical protein
MKLPVQLVYTNEMLKIKDQYHNTQSLEQLHSRRLKMSSTVKDENKGNPHHGMRRCEPWLPVKSV